MIISEEYRKIAKEITDTMSNDKYFLLFIEWAMNNNETILYELDELLEHYMNDREWLNYLSEVVEE